MNTARGDDERDDVAKPSSAAASTERRKLLDPRDRWIASIANQVRSSLASIVYSADFVDARVTGAEQELLQAALHDISDAGRGLQLTVDGLLDYARLGPAIAVPVCVRELLNRVQRLLRALYREEAHRLHVVMSAGAEWVSGNPMAIEQELLDALLLATEHQEGPRVLTVRCTREPAAAPRANQVLITIEGGARLVQRWFHPSQGPR